MCAAQIQTFHLSFLNQPPAVLPPPHNRSLSYNLSSKKRPTCKLWLRLFHSFSLSVPVVCCCRRATSSQRLSTTISWPLGAGQLWLVSTALLSFPPPPLPLFFSNLLTVSSLSRSRLCCVQATPSSRLRFCRARVIGGKGQRVHS